MSLSITWLGHSAFLLVLEDGKRVLVDPWITNPNCPAEFARTDALKPLDLILVSHGHSDHVGEVVHIARATGAPVVCMFEVGVYLAEKGLETVRDMGIGGTQDVNGIAITMTQAMHSGSIMEGSQIVYLGGAAGYVVRAPGTPTFYFAGDTGIFGDMKIIGELYRPELAMIPIGDLFTMAPREAAYACRLLDCKMIIPMHYSTFPVLTGTPQALRQETAAIEGLQILEMKPGETLK